jgi:hypothetical protein
MAWGVKDVNEFFRKLARDHNIQKLSLQEQTEKALAGKETPQASLNEKARTAPEKDAR